MTNDVSPEERALLNERRRAMKESEKERAEAKAQVCLNLGIAPSEYDSLTMVEVQAFLKEQERINRRAKR